MIRSRAAFACSPSTLNFVRASVSRTLAERAAHQLFSVAVQADRALSDVDRLVANALEVRHQSKSRGEKPQIVGHWLSQRKNSQDKGVRLELVAIDLSVESFDFSHDLRSSMAEGIERETHDSLAPSAHRQ